MQAITDSKQITIPKKTTPSVTRTNPDSSTSLYTTYKLRTEAHILSDNKLKFNEDKERKKSETVIKSDVLKKKIKGAFKNILNTIKKRATI